MKLATIWLTFRLHQFAVTGIGLACFALATLAIWYAARLDAFPTAIACLTQGGESCQPYLDLHAEAGRILFAVGFLPILAGIFLGVPLVALELERSTTSLAWSLEPSRWRWFMQRSIPVVAFVVVLGLVTGVTADHLETRLFPFADPGASFHDYGLRGPLVAGRLLLALGCGVLIGALVGRTLPAMLITFVIAAVLGAAISTFNQGIHAGLAVPVAAEEFDITSASRQVDFRYQLPSGELMTWEQLESRFPDPADLELQLSSTEQLVYVIPAEHYGAVSILEVAGASALGVSFMAATGVTLIRRHPGPGGIRLGMSRYWRRQRRRGFRSDDKVGLVRFARLALWPPRLELMAGASVGLVFSVACVVVVATLLSSSPPAKCLEDLANIPVSPDCAIANRFLDVASDWGNTLFASMAVLPWIVGALIGVVVVGREIEEGTAPLAWSLSPDRRRWLITRALVAAALVALLLTVPAALATEMQRIARPWVVPESTLDNFGLRGPLVVMRGLAGFSIALLAGAVLGRIVSGLLVAGVLCAGLFLGLQLLWPFGQPLEDLPQPEPGGPVAVSPVQQGVPGERFPEVELREGLFLAGVSLAIVAFTTVVVERRRPS